MLTRPEKYRCIECATLYGTDKFSYYEGIVENGPAYWSDQGLLCSSKCSLIHYKKRMDDGSLPHEPAPNPLEADLASKG